MVRRSLENDKRVKFLKASRSVEVQCIFLQFTHILVLHSHFGVHEAINDGVDARVKPRDHAGKHVNARIDLDRLGNEVDDNAWEEEDHKSDADCDADAQQTPIHALEFKSSNYSERPKCRNLDLLVYCCCHNMSVRIPIITYKYLKFSPLV